MTMIQAMVVDIAQFLVVFSISFFIFAAMGQILFTELAEFNDLWISIKTLYSDVLGGYDYAKFDNISNVGKWVGYIYLSAALLVVLIILLNFLIAILSNTYTILIEVSRALFLRGVILYHDVVGDSKRWSFMSSTFAPFNMIVLPFIPFQILC